MAKATITITDIDGGKDLAVEVTSDLSEDQQVTPAILAATVFAKMATNGELAQRTDALVDALEARDGHSQ